MLIPPADAHLAQVEFSHAGHESGGGLGLGVGPQRVVGDEGVVVAIEDYILDNGIQPGDRLLGERDLAEALGVSRSALREGLAVLRGRGRVRSHHGRGLFLTEPPATPPASGAGAILTLDDSLADLDLPFIWETRQALETQCARVAALRATREDIDRMREALDLMSAEVAAGRPGLEGDRRFHAAVAAASHNPILAGLLSSIHDALALTSERSLGRDGQPRRSLADHRAILDAIVRHEPTESADAMLIHLVGTTDSVRGPQATTAEPFVER